MSLAGFAGAGVADVALTEDVLMILEAHTASHAATGIGLPVSGTNWDEVVWTGTGKTCRQAGGGGVGGHRKY